MQIWLETQSSSFKGVRWRLWVIILIKWTFRDFEGEKKSSFLACSCCDCLIGIIRRIINNFLPNFQSFCPPGNNLFVSFWLGYIKKMSRSGANVSVSGLDGLMRLWIKNVLSHSRTRAWSIGHTRGQRSSCADRTPVLPQSLPQKDQVYSVGCLTEWVLLSRWSSISACL